MPLYAKVTAYRGHIICDMLVDESNEDARTSHSPGYEDNAIINTKENLGISMEALALLKTVKKGKRSLGDIDWFPLEDGRAVFGWFGTPHQIFNIRVIEGSRDYCILDYVPIPNDVPQGAINCIDRNIHPTLH